MGKRIAIEDRTTYRVQGYVTEKAGAALEKYCARKKIQISDVVRDMVNELLAKA